MIWLPVRFEPLMDLPTQAHLNTLRDVLNYRLVELRADVHAAEQEWLGARAPAGADVADRKDRAARGQLTCTQRRSDLRAQLPDVTVVDCRHTP